ncbi:predicted protein [Chaetomium globosum CBS 148.51]|uniref:Uncharacterized protein n=1 Tax=Chaetomium globosum (strain ATCC 6205 / CBS 148.51 / DSM 1962 / NBRC 6347 / NRRL 1970) TaxID=306901 RepID=Q2GMK2_CHAGB|nr:uncharacterized protein CHGG_10802 [Chaetomium globosum CBS 148.51]EAQ82984.1 predicted protein [Chaetomium globosum CBS 148.51]
MYSLCDPPVPRQNHLLNRNRPSPTPKAPPLIHRPLATPARPRCCTTSVIRIPPHLSPCPLRGPQEPIYTLTPATGAVSRSTRPTSAASATATAQVASARLRRDYLAAGGVDGVVFVVDAADYEDGLKEARGEFEELLRVLGEIEEGRDCAAGKRMPVLVLGNKIDKPGAVAEEELRDLLGGLSSPVGVGNEMSRGREASRPVKLFMCSVVMGQGYKEGFAWLANNA